MAADDKIIQQIDDELLKIDYASRTKTEYKVFDFYTAIKAFKESMLADITNRKEYFSLKINQYRSVFYDLFFTESKVVSIEYLDYDPEKRTLKQKETVSLNMPPYTRDEHIYETIIEDQDRHNRWKQLKAIDTWETEPCTIRMNKYDYLLEGCFPKIETPGQMADYIRETTPNEMLKSDFYELFSAGSPTNGLNDLTFEGYIKQLKFEKTVTQSQKIDKPAPEQAGIKEQQSIKEEKNPFPRIFINNKAWELFDTWKNEYLKEEKADLCFIYWQMLRDNLIYDIKPTEYKGWLFDNFKIDFGDYWKQEHRVNGGNKIKDYSRLKNQTKQSK
jgi:hypothetical protein